MRLEDAKASLDRCRELGYTYCILSGGEVLLDRPLVEALIAYGHQLGFVMNIETNCWWATSADEAERYLEHLTSIGLDSLLLSTDTFHLPYIPIERLIDISHAADKLGIVYSVGVVLSRDPERDNAVIAQLTAAGVPFITYPINPYGDASHLPDKMLDFRTIDELPECDELCMLILPNKKILGCCNPGIYPEHAPLYLNTEHAMDISIADQLFNTDPIIRTIGQYGVKELYWKYCELRVGSDPLRRFPSICAVCQLILSDRYVVAQLSKECTKQYFV